MQRKRRLSEILKQRWLESGVTDVHSLGEVTTALLPTDRAHPDSRRTDHQTAAPHGVGARVLQVTRRKKEQEKEELLQRKVRHVKQVWAAKVMQRGYRRRKQFLYASPHMRRAVSSRSPRPAPTSCALPSHQLLTPAAHARARAWRRRRRPARPGCAWKAWGARTWARAR